MSITIKKLEKAEAAAEALWKEMYEPDKADEKAEEKVGETEEAPKEEVAEPEEVPEEPTEVAVEETAEEKPEEKPAEAVVAKPEEKPEKPKSDDFKQKYQTLEGKYKAEVPRLQAEIKQWMEYTTGLQKRIEELEKAPKALKEPERDPGMETIETEYPDIAKQLKKAEERHQAEIKKLREEFESNVTEDMKTVKSDIHASKQDRFDMSMRQLGVPDWKEIDRDPGFIEWLQVPVPYTRATKLDFLQEAARNLDAETTAKFFLDYKASTMVPKEEPEGQPDKLNKFTAPPRSSGSNPPKQTAQTGLTRERYLKFYDPKYRFTPSDWNGKTEAQVEAMFDAALQKGQISF